MFILPDKQPGETVKGYWVDFTNRFVPGETIANVSVTSSIPGIISGSPEYAGTVVTWDCTGGTDGDKVIITVKATGSMGSVRETDLILNIREELLP